jgi:penicillin-binding protein 1A
MSKKKDYFPIRIKIQQYLKTIWFNKIRRVNIYKLFAGILSISIIFVLLLLGSIYAGIFGKLPDANTISSIKNYQASMVYSADNVLLGKYYLQNRTNTMFSELPEFVSNALIATEDARFYQHNGIDTRSLGRVLFKTLLLQDESAGGGSTITQQLAKNLYPRRHHFILSLTVNKIREMIIAVRLEKVYSKHEILQLYLNTVPFGENTYGIEAASEHYFSKNPQKLRIEEAAVLIGMLKATNTYNPVNNPDASLARRNTVLSQMEKYGYLKKETEDSLRQLSLKTDYRLIDHNTGLATYFREHLRLELEKWCTEHPKSDGSVYNLYTDGLRIYTTINSKMQKYAEEAVSQQMRTLQKAFYNHWKGRIPWQRYPDYINDFVKRSDRYQKMKKAGFSEKEIEKTFHTKVKTSLFSWSGDKEDSLTPVDSIKYYQYILHTGFMAMELPTGYVRAWVGGINHKYFKYDHVLSTRQVGSTFKPFVYAAALADGYEPCDFISNDSITYTDYDNWTPRNAEGGYGGEYSLKGALSHSVNTIAVKLLMSTGINNVIKLAHQLGITEELPAVPSLALGTAEISLYEMIRAYSTFPNKGKPVEPVYIQRIEDNSGNVLYQNKPEKQYEQVLDEKVAAMMNRMLQNVVDSGTAAGLRSRYGMYNEIAGKTGTTQSQADGWFIGYTPVMIAGAWVGAENPVIRFRSLALGQGAHTALPVWALFMKKVFNDPDYRNADKYTFPPLPEDLEASFEACPEFVPDEKNIIDILFNRRNKRNHENLLNKIIDLLKKRKKDKEKDRHKYR